jgi:hypothetical protein
MKNIILIVGLIAFIANLLLGMVIHPYSGFNVFLNSCVIALNTLLIYVVSIITLKDAFKISLSLIYLCLGIVEYILGFFASSKLENNWYLIIIIVLATFEAVILAMTNGVTKINK